MSTATYGMIEIVMFFGGILGFCWYQLYSLKKLRREDAEARARGEDPAERARGRNEKKAAEDIFWDTIATKR